MSRNETMDLRDTIIPKSDQLNADGLLAGPITITVTDVRRGSGDDQPLVIHYQGENGRPYKPCKSMRRVLVFAWGADGADWVGRSMTLYNRQDVKFGGQQVGGIRISDLSHIRGPIEIPLTVTRGKREPVRIGVIRDIPGEDGVRAQLVAAALSGMESLRTAWEAVAADMRRVIGPRGCPDDLKKLAATAAAPAPEDSGPPADDEAAS